MRRRSSRPQVAVPGSERRGARKSKRPRVARKGPSLPEPTACDGCGAIYQDATWRFDHPITGDLLEKAHWGTCPACKQTREGIGYGRVCVTGEGLAEQIDALRRRIDNVATQAAEKQPQRRLVSVDWDGEQLDVITTSQKLAHRVAHELKKQLGGKTTYNWSDRDGSLLATLEV